MRGEARLKPPKRRSPRLTVGRAQTFAGLCRAKGNTTRGAGLDTSPEAKRRVLRHALERLEGEERAIVAAALSRLCV